MRAPVMHDHADGRVAATEDSSRIERHSCQLRNPRHFAVVGGPSRERPREDSARIVVAACFPFCFERFRFGRR